METIARKATYAVKGYATKDGAGVSLIRVLGNTTAELFDPILMLDSFDTEDYDAYKAGFPMHPHRGIETITFLSHGRIEHRDTLGFSDTVSDGEVQYMTAGAGVEHEERLPKSDRLTGLQLWLNLPAKDKMTAPHYHAVKREAIQEIPVNGGTLRLLTGSYREHQGYQTHHLPLDYYHITLQEGASLSIDTDPSRSCMAFTLQGRAEIGGEKIDEKTAVKLSEGDYVKITALDGEAEVMFMSSVALKEPVYWGGPIVMDTQEGLEETFRQLRNGTFLAAKRV